MFGELLLNEKFKIGSLLSGWLNLENESFAKNEKEKKRKGLTKRVNTIAL